MRASPPDMLPSGRTTGSPVTMPSCSSGARVHYVEGISPNDSPDSVLMEGVTDAFTEYYSLQLSANIRRGQRYNAERALSNGHKIFGFAVGEDKRYIPNPETAPIVTQVFDDCASGVSMQKIADRLNAQGVRTTHGYKFTPKSLNKLLKNRAYISEYAYGGHVIDGGMPRLVEDEVFEKVQRRFAINKRRRAKTKAELAAQGDDAPDYWLTGRAYCLTCGGPMEVISGTSKTGKTYRYYYCLNQRKKKCSAKTVRKDEIEVRIEEIVAFFLADPERLASLAVDLADHYQQTHERGDEILKASSTTPPPKPCVPWKSKSVSLTQRSRPSTSRRRCSRIRQASAPFTSASLRLPSTRPRPASSSSSISLTRCSSGAKASYCTLWHTCYTRSSGR